MDILSKVEAAVSMLSTLADDSVVIWYTAKVYQCFSLLTRNVISLEKSLATSFVLN